MTDIPAGVSAPGPESVPSLEDLHSLQIRIGTVVRAEPNAGARDAAYKLWVDFGPLGVKQSSAKVTDRYEPDLLVGRQVAAVTGFAPLRVGGFRSDVLVIGALTDAGVVLLAPDIVVPDGSAVA